MILSEAQALHVRLTAKLIEFAYAQGMALTWGETYRTPEQARLNAQNGTGILNSLHCDRLAVDLNLWKDGVYVTDADAYKPLADYWQSLHPLARAGYYFASRDADHFSITWGGRS